MRTHRSVDVTKVPELRWLALLGLFMTLPPGWKAVRRKGADTSEPAYYWNEETGESTWEHPADSVSSAGLCPITAIAVAAATPRRTAAPPRVSI